MQIKVKTLTGKEIQLNFEINALAGNATAAATPATTTTTGTAANAVAPPANAVTPPANTAAPPAGAAALPVKAAAAPPKTDIKVLEIKQAIEEKEGIPPAQQRLIFSGIQMVDDKYAIKDYSVQGGSVLHLVLALRGGSSAM